MFIIFYFEVINFKDFTQTSTITMNNYVVHQIEQSQKFDLFKV